MPDKHPDNGTNQFLANFWPNWKENIFLAQKLTELEHYSSISQIFNRKSLKYEPKVFKTVPGLSLIFNYHMWRLSTTFFNFPYLWVKYHLCYRAQCGWGDLSKNFEGKVWESWNIEQILPLNTWNYQLTFEFPPESCSNILEYSSNSPKYIAYNNRKAYFDNLQLVFCSSITLAN